MRSRDGARAAALDEWIATTASRFADRIAPVDVAVAQRWGHLAAVPDPLPVVDSIIAATALTHGWTVATRNTADFARFGVELHNPFRG